MMRFGSWLQKGRAANPAPKSATRTGKLIISGTGRAGTTLLMRIFTRLGLDTGFTERDFAEVERRISKAGLEKPITAETAPTLPEVIKTPFLTQLLRPALREGWFTVDHAIIPIRSLAEAAGSRASVYERAKLAGREPRGIAGGLWGVENPEDQQADLAIKFHALIDTLVEHEIPFTFLNFPRFARESDYFVSVLGGLLHSRYGLSEQDLRAAHAGEANLSYIGKHSS